MGRKVAGLMFLKINGQQYSLKGNVNVSPLNLERESVVGLDKVHGFKEKPKVPFIEATITDMANLSLKDLYAMDNATVTIELASGKTYVLSNAYFAGTGETNPEEGEISVKFEGEKCEEMLGNA